MKARLALTVLIFASLAPKWADAANRIPPSAKIEPLLEPCLNAILAPLQQNPKMPRVRVETLRATFAGGLVTASTPAQQQIYQNAMAVCDAMTNDMDARASARAAAQASASMPTLSNGGDIISSAPVRGWDAGADAQAIRGKQKDERAYADKSAATQSAFTESSAYTTWVNNAPALRKNVMDLYTRQVELEALEAKNAPPAVRPAPPQNPAPAPQPTEIGGNPGGTNGSSSKAPYIGVGSWTGRGGHFKYIINAGQTVVRVDLKDGTKVKGTWKVDSQGVFHARFEDNTVIGGHFSDDGKTLTSISGKQFDRDQQ